MLETNCDLFSLASCSCRLVSKSRYKLNLLLGERPHLGAGQCEDADWDALAQHGNPEDGAKVSQLLGFCEGVVRVGKDVGDMNDLAFEQRACGDRSAFGNDR